MDKQWLSEFYQGLRVLEEITFPKVCAVCGETYTDLDDFLDRTKAVPKSSGLAKYKQGPKVGLFRNCKCNSTLMVNCRDRRETSPDKVSRREVFGKLMDMLMAKGIEKTIARRELLKILKSEESLILKPLGITIK